MEAMAWEPQWQEEVQAEQPYRASNHDEGNLKSVESDSKVPPPPLEILCTINIHTVYDIQVKYALPIHL